MNKKTIIFLFTTPLYYFSFVYHTSALRTSTTCAVQSDVSNFSLALLAGEDYLLRSIIIVIDPHYTYIWYY